MNPTQRSRRRRGGRSCLESAGQAGFQASLLLGCLPAALAAPLIAAPTHAVPVLAAALLALGVCPPGVGPAGPLLVAAAPYGFRAGRGLLGGVGALRVPLPSRSF